MPQIGQKGKSRHRSALSYFSPSSSSSSSFLALFHFLPLLLFLVRIKMHLLTSNLSGYVRYLLIAVMKSVQRIKKGWIFDEITRETGWPPYSKRTRKGKDNIKLEYFNGLGSSLSTIIYGPAEALIIKIITTSCAESASLYKWKLNLYWEGSLSGASQTLTLKPWVNLSTWKYY